MSISYFSRLVPIFRCDQAALTYCFGFILLLGAQAKAVDIHSLLSIGCRVESGLIVDVTDTDVVMVGLDGKEKLVARSTLESIFVSTAFENPVSQIQLTPNLQESRRQFTVTGGATFSGWPVRFIEDLIVFFDTSGKTRVYRLESIESITSTPETAVIQIDGAHPAELDLRQISAECPNPNTPRGEVIVRPTRILSDRIKVDQYLEDLQTGYQKLERLQERTHFYARPFLFDKKTRLAFVYAPPGVERAFSSALSIQWSSGKPFHFQSYNRLGSQPLEFSPYALPTYAFRSDLKAHLFHIHFSGDLRGLSTGESLYKGGASGTNNRDDVDPDKNELGKKYGEDSELQTGMNYVLMMGVDYGPLSFSAGYFFGPLLIRVKKQNSHIIREVLANQANNAFRVMYTNERTRWRLFYVPLKYYAESVSNQDIVSYRTDSLPSSFSLEANYLRGGVDWDLPNGMQFSGDLLLTRGKYSARGDVYGDESFNFQKSAVVLSLRKEFGDYIALRLTHTQFYIVNEYSGFGGTPGISTSSPNSFGGEFEFIF